MHDSRGKLSTAKHNNHLLPWTVESAPDAIRGMCIYQANPDQLHHDHYIPHTLLQFVLGELSLLKHLIFCYVD